MFSSDYYRVHDNTSLPIRWMAWESVRLRKFTTKSDVWSFGVTLWEILNLARHRPYEGLTDLEVLENISHLHADDGEFIYLPTPQTTKDILDLMNECWKRSPTERPSFTEIHLFLQRKNLGYVPPMNS
ncbi:discoidin domain-containing receptor 2-like [Diaphorina citri]|uniref:Discoidin domain-containing receptor 2-like n=1 Tax=Diaphorina citri TaxID=121845 RepID=A0A3Q0JM14_DIACI|nr:discoidin domain-containing receptor 2-like [Diaphorina citri]